MQAVGAPRDAVGSLHDDSQLVRLPMSWTGFTGLATALGDDNHVRLAYNGETLELMSPGFAHEKLARFISAVLVYTLDAWAIEYEDAGSTTFRRAPDGGFEADASFYIANADATRGLSQIDLGEHRAPDLVLEVDISNRRLDKKALYARFGVIEFWRYADATGLQVFALTDGAYEQVHTSRLLSGLPIAIVQNCIVRFKAGEKRSAIVSTFRQWLDDNRQLYVILNRDEHASRQGPFRNSSSVMA